MPKHVLPENPLTATYIVSSDSETDPESRSIIGMRRFTYQNPSNPQLKASVSRTSSIAVPENPVVNPTRKKQSSRTTVQHRFTADFSEAELMELSKCVCCGERWTIRKGVAQKMAHIQSCAKKNALTDITVKIIIRQEVDKALAEKPTSGAKGKGKAVDLESMLPGTPRTFMEDVVQEAGPKRKERRPERVQSVKDVTESVDVIRDRARTVLENYALPNTQEVDDRRQTQDFRPSRLLGQGRRDFGISNGHPATQDFGRSNLGQRHASSNGLNMFSDAFQGDPVPYIENSGQEASIPPSTQAFAPSKLGVIHQPPKSSPCESPHSPKLVRTLPFMMNQEQD